MLDISETLEAGVHIITYADNIVLCVIDSNEDCSRWKIQNTLARISTWCQANKLFIEPTNCYVINFSRRCDPDEPLTLQGVELPWKTQIKIIGIIWFTRTLRFMYRFNVV